MSVEVNQITKDFKQLDIKYISSLSNEKWDEFMDFLDKDNKTLESLINISLGDAIEGYYLQKKENINNEKKETLDQKIDRFKAESQLESLQKGKQMLKSSLHKIKEEMDYE